MNSPLIDKPVMIITGTRKGIGNYLAKYYTDKGFCIIGCSRDDIDFELDNYQHYCLDISDEPSVKKMFAEIRKKYGRLDILINNAGVNYALSPLLLVPYESALKTIKINLLGTFLMSREAVKIMMKKSFGRIINFGSMAVKHEVKGEAIYTASKAAIISFTRVIAKEVYSYGITCNVLSPSAIDTDLMKNVNNDALNEVLSRNVIPDVGKIEDVSHTIDWLIKSKSNAITGQNIFLGGV
jgi:3-oxoacyl-[acyl-carrier protein] reductase